jgi:hypothetical protein
MKTKIIAILLVMLLVLPLAFAEDSNDTNADTTIDANTPVPTLIAEVPDANEVVTDTNMEEEVIADTDEPVEEELVEEVAEEAIDTTTTEEIQIMQDNLGSQIRILQLQHATLRSYLVGNEVIAILSERADTSNMEAIQAEISLLNDEAFALSETSETVKEDFVAIKRDLKTSIADFRADVNGQLTIDERTQIKETVRANEELLALNQTIKETIREHNHGKVKAMLARMDVKKQDVLDKIKSGELTAEQVKTRMKDEYKKLPMAKKKIVKKAVVAKVVAQEKAKAATRAKIVKNYLTVQKERINNRLEKLSPEAKKKLQANKDKILKKLSNVREKLQEQNKELTQNKIKKRLDNIRGEVQ